MRKDPHESGLSGERGAQISQNSVLSVQNGAETKLKRIKCLEDNFVNRVKF